jgi:hypothetical protein
MKWGSYFGERRRAWLHSFWLNEGLTFSGIDAAAPVRFKSAL